MKPEEIVKKMMDADHFSQWLGISVEKISERHCVLKMVIGKQMLNGFGIAHGGIAYSFADSALAFASNSGGRQSLSIETSISHTRSLKEGDVIFAEASCETESERIGNYKVYVYKQQLKGEIVALFKGTVYRTSKTWEGN
jgi:acyl-CoA thioesterase